MRKLLGLLLMSPFFIILGLVAPQVVAAFVVFSFFVIGLILLIE
jgi:ABC-type multidrug transport system permease subunit